MSRKKNDDDNEAQIYSKSNGFFLRDFRLSRKNEFNNSKNHLKNWKDFEFLLGNCCDRLLRDIDDRFEFLAEYLWEKVEADEATPTVVQGVFRNNLDQIDQYLVLQFEYAKEQLQNVMRSSRSKQQSAPSLESAGFSSPLNRSSNSQNSRSLTNTSSPTVVSGSGNGNRLSSTSYNSSRSALSRPADVLNSPTLQRPNRRTSRLTVPKIADTSTIDSDSASYGSAEDLGPPTRLQPYSDGELRKQRSDGGNGTTTADSDPYRDNKKVFGFPSNASLSSVCRRALSYQLPFGLGVLAGAIAVIALLFLAPYLTPYLPASVREIIPSISVFWKDGTHPQRPSAAHHHTTQSRHAADRKKPYDAFWTSCGHSFVDWWAYSWHLLFGQVSG